MNVFNRVVVILLLLAMVVFLPILMIVPGPLFSLVGREVTYAEAYLTPINRLLIVVVGALLLVVCVLLLWLELRRPRRRMIKVPQVSGGEAELTTDSIAQRIAHNVGQVPEVVKAVPKVFGRRQGVEVRLDLETSPDIDVPAKTEEVCQVARREVEERIGLKLHKIRVNIRHAPYGR